MSMHHVSLKSPQTIAWCEHAHNSVGRVMVGFEGMKGRDKSATRQATLLKLRIDISQKKHERICTYLDTFNDSSKIPEVPKGMTKHTKNVYVKILRGLGFIKMVKTVDKFNYYVRCREIYPTFEQVNDWVTPKTLRR